MHSKHINDPRSYSPVVRVIKQDALPRRASRCQRENATVIAGHIVNNGPKCACDVVLIVTPLTLPRAAIIQRLLEPC